MLRLGRGEGLWRVPGRADLELELVRPRCATMSWTWLPWQGLDQSRGWFRVRKRKTAWSESSILRSSWDGPPEI